ncbi:MAG TPA: preprotein translocase subunit YajC [Tepidisphaeraceae bacterium]|nr:preprotein translocase subunit YajC [Tepidisphaeraceae bacterium]
MSTIAMNWMMTLLAAATAPAAPAPEPGLRGLLQSPMLPLVGVMLIIMYFSFNSKRKQEKQKKELLNAMKKGDRIQTIGGILGTVVDLRDLEVVVKVDEGNNTKLKFMRSAILRVVREDEKADLK